MLAPDIELPTVAPAAEPTIAGMKQLNAVFRAGADDYPRRRVISAYALLDGVSAAAESMVILESR